jgi:hypothetical protein
VINQFLNGEADKGTPHRLYNAAKPWLDVPVWFYQECCSRSPQIKKYSWFLITCAHISLRSNPIFAENTSHRKVILSQECRRRRPLSRLCTRPSSVSCIKIHCNYATCNMQLATCNFSKFLEGQNGILTAWGWLTTPWRSLVPEAALAVFWISRLL